MLVRLTALLVAADLWSTGACASEAVLNELTVGIDGANGCIVRLEHPATGPILVASPDAAGLLDVAYPVPEFAALRLGSQHSAARVEPEGEGFRIRYDRLGASRGNVPLPEGTVTADVVVRPASDGRTVVMSCHIENHSQAPVPQVLFPDLHGLRPVAGPDQTRLRFGLGAVTPFLQPFRGVDFAPLFYVERGWQAYPPCGYYGLKEHDINSLRWLDYGGYAGGLCVFQRKWGTPDWPTVRTQRRESDPGSLRLLWDHQVTIAPGQSWDSGEFWFTPHAGGWAKGIEVYREYVKTVNETRPLPRHVRDGLGFRTAWMIQATEVDPAKAAFRFADIPRLAADAKEHGLEELCLWGQCRYSVMPIRVCELLGTRDEFIRAVRKSRKEGVNIAPFVSVQIVHNPHAGRYGLKPGTNNWTYHPEMIPNFTPYYSDVHNGVQVPPENEVWRKDVTETLTDWIQAGVPSFGWDVLPLTPGADGKCPVVELLRPLRELAHAKQKEATCAGEVYTPGAFEFAGSLLDYTWNWVDYHEAGPIRNVIQNPRLNCHVEDSVRTARLAFADGLYLNVMPRRPDQPNGTAYIAEHPDLSSTLQELAALRRRFLPYFVDGVFLGDSILSRPAQAHVAAYQRGNRLLVIVLNDTDQPQAAELDAPLQLWLGPDTEYRVREWGPGTEGASESGYTPTGRWTCTTRPLGPLEFAFYEVEARPAVQ